jgi:hypothetical protein
MEDEHEPENTLLGTGGSENLKELEKSSIQVSLPLHNHPPPYPL